MLADLMVMLLAQTIVSLVGLGLQAASKILKVPLVRMWALLIIIMRSKGCRISGCYLGFDHLMLRQCVIAHVSIHQQSFISISGFMLKALLLPTLLLSVLSFSILNDYHKLTDDQACRDSYNSLVAQTQNIPPRLNVTAKVYGQTLFDCVRSVPATLQACDLPLQLQWFGEYLPSKCIDELQQIETLVDLIDRDTSNVTKTLHIAQLTAHVQIQFPARCPKLYTLINSIINRSELTDKPLLLMDGEVTPKCGEAAYQYSLLLQNLYQDLTRRSSKLSNDLILAITGLPDFLDECNQKHLADQIRRDLPKNCLESIQVFVGEVEQFVFHHSHLEWMFKHRKDLVKDFQQIRYTCPLFG